MPYQLVKKHLKNWFDYPKSKVYCQVSTSSNGCSHIRTMDLYHVTEDGELVLITETSTRKWQDLKLHPNIAICILHVEQGQMITEGYATLKTISEDSALVHFYWEKYLDQYWRDFYIARAETKSTAINGVPSTFGVIIVKPHFWEILEINQNDYAQSTRKQFHLQKDSWTVKNVSPV